VHVNGPGAAEVVVAPDFLQELSPGEHPAGLLGQELQQLELLERQVERAPVHPGRVGGLVDDQLAGPDLAGLLGNGAGRAPEAQPDPRLDLAGAGRMQHHIVGAPVSRDRGPAPLGHDDQYRYLVLGPAQGLQQPLGLDQVASRVDQHGIGLRAGPDRRRHGRADPDAVREQRQRWQNLGGRLMPAR
jgi:hypothetical protein